MILFQLHSVWDDAVTVTECWHDVVTVRVFWIMFQLQSVWDDVASHRECFGSCCSSSRVSGIMLLQSERLG